MTQETQRTVTVQPGGKIELTTPEFAEGSQVEVTISLKKEPETAEEIEAKQARVAKAVKEFQDVVKAHFSEEQMLSEELIQERRAESQYE
ncbi:MAG: hypothetical protein ACOC04_02610 [Halothece sp.]